MGVICKHPVMGVGRKNKYSLMISKYVNYSFPFLCTFEIIIEMHVCERWRDKIGH